MKILRNLILVVALAPSSSLFADGVIEEGSITEASKEIGMLVHLKWQGDRLGVDREHWDRSTGNKTEADKEQERMDAMVERGIPKEIVEKMMAQPRQRGLGANFLVASPEGELFESLKIALGAHSGGGGGGGEDMQWDGRGNGVNANMLRSGPMRDWQLRILETADPGQEIVVEDHFLKGLRIQFTTASRLMVFHVSPEGKVRVAHTSEERSEAFQTKSYSEMAELHPEFLKDFNELLEGIGVNIPLTDRDPRVTDAVGKLLQIPTASVREAAQKAVEGLKSDSYETREASHMAIRDNFEAWYSVIGQVKDGGGLPAEIRSRLDSICDEFERPNEEEQFIRNRNLLSNPEYLASIVGEMPKRPREAVENHISELKAAGKTSP